MDSIVSQNIRGLNWPNRQEDVCSFLYNNKVGIIGLLETEVKDKNVDKVVGKTFPGWLWQHNFEYDTKGRIQIAQKPSSYNVQVLKMTDQLVHCYTTQLSTHKTFYATFVYGMNQEHMRMPQWADLQALAQ